MSTSDWIGLVGGIVGFLGATVSIAEYRRDQAKLLIRWTPNMKIVSADNDNVRLLLASLEDLPVPPALYYRDPDKTWISVDVVNDGRRPIKVEKVGLVTDGDPPYSIFADFEAKSLAEGDNIRQSIDQAKFADVTILAAIATDGASRSHYGGFRRGFAGLVDRCKRFFGLGPFSR